MITHWISATKEMSLREKLHAEMLNAKVEEQFASKAAEIVRKRQPFGTGMDEWDPNEVLRIREFNKNVEIGIQIYHTIKGIYETTFDDVDDVEKAIKVAADIMSNMMLVKFGWIKEEGKC